MTGWSVCEDTCDTAALVVSELVTNAIVHTASDIVVCELRDGDDLIRIAVRDQGCSPDEPHPSPQRPEEEHGRGLLLVEALCQAWGAQEHGLGLLVWADLPRKADAPQQAAAFCDDPGPDFGLGPVVEPHHAGLGELLDTLDEFPDGTGEQHDGPPRPHNDLGWGARPKPGPADGPDDEDDRPQQLRQEVSGAAVPRPRPAAPAPTAGPLPRIAPQWHRTADHGGDDGRDGCTPGHPARALPLGYGRERGRI
ncbi:hypothetical protein GCM10010269_07910 [Streptomyces humidus]|uniref:Histidine kinase/HSP90-like ATPase domain-containing protein n=1 Tax=Streptomyces humidus TaxID=52259 RepID=A0A918FRC9_9ACTN|nr:hypothetical protein GCM10010269_07910 [Streptomyces humidus]